MGEGTCQDLPLSSGYSDGGMQEGEKERNESRVKSQRERNDLLGLKEAKERTGERVDGRAVPGLRLAQPQVQELNIWL